jgi:hypothetical protein
MDVWVVSLRGSEDIQLEFRALLGPPEVSFGAVAAYVLEASSPASAAQSLEAAVLVLGQGSAAAACARVGRAPAEVYDAAFALALAGAPGEFLLNRPAALALAPFVLFTRPKTRPGWRLPTAAVALADAPRQRVTCRAAAWSLPETPRFLGREDALQELLDAVETAAEQSPAPPVVLRAPPASGATRLVLEAAALAGATLVRHVTHAHELDRPPSDDALAALAFTQTFERLRSSERPRPPWLLIELVGPARPEHTAAFFDALRAKYPTLTVIARVAPEVSVPWEDPTLTVSLGPLAPGAARDLVRAMLGDRADDALVDLLVRRGGAPQALVTAVRAAVAEGVARRESDASGRVWRTRPRRLVRARSLDVASDRVRSRSLYARHLAALDPPTRRAFTLACSLGDDVDEYALRALLRVVLGQPESFDALRAHGLLTVIQSRVDLGASRVATVPVDVALVARVDRLRRAGALDLLALAEKALTVRHRDAPLAVVRAARGALKAGDRAVAVRLLAACGEPPSPEHARVFAQASRAVATAIGPVVQLTARTISGVTPAVATLTPDELERMATLRESRGDDDSAERLRALAALLRGDAIPALRLAAEPRTARDHLLRALAHARGGRMMAAVRDAVTALTRARRAGDSSGESASLALLASLYTALGRSEEASELARRVRAR